jgi:hypothetical protein
MHVDVLERSTGGRWRLVEVKSTTQVKPEHLADVAIQQFVLRGCGVKFAGVYLMHLDRTYVYSGGEYDYDRRFTITDVSSDVKAAEALLPEQLRAERAVLRKDSSPDIEPGPQCSHPADPADVVPMTPRGMGHPSQKRPRSRVNRRERRKSARRTERVANDGSDLITSRSINAKSLSARALNQAPLPLTPQRGHVG